MPGWEGLLISYGTHLAVRGHQPGGGTFAVVARLPPLQERPTTRSIQSWLKPE